MGSCSLTVILSPCPDTVSSGCAVLGVRTQALSAGTSLAVMGTLCWFVSCCCEFPSQILTSAGLCVPQRAVWHIFLSSRWLCSTCTFLSTELVREAAVPPPADRSVRSSRAARSVASPPVPSTRLVTWFCHFCVPHPHTLLVRLLHSLSPSSSSRRPGRLKSPPPVLPPAAVRSAGRRHLVPVTRLLSPQTPRPHPPPSAGHPLVCPWLLHRCWVRSKRWAMPGGGSAGRLRGQPLVGARVHQHPGAGLSPLLL